MTILYKHTLIVNARKKKNTICYRDTHRFVL